MVVAGVILASPAAAPGCPFCSAPSPTLTDRLQVGNVMVLARYLEPVPSPSPAIKLARFEIVRIFRGEEELAGRREIIANPVEGHSPMAEDRWLLVGVDPPDIYWSQPMLVSERAVRHIERLPQAPTDPVERLVWFIDPLLDSDPVIAQDAYDEFAKSAYDVVGQAAHRFDRRRLLHAVRDPDTAEPFRRLYFTLLGLCGQPADADEFAPRVFAGRTEPDPSLDAAIACYITLRGEAGLVEIEDRLLRPADAPFAVLNSAVLAIRFHGQDEDKIPQARLAAALRIIVRQHPRWADLVALDLARWNDWSVLPDLVEIFKSAQGDAAYVKLPIVQYVKACPLPAAANYLAEMERHDPQTVRRASLGLLLPRSGRDAASTRRKAAPLESSSQESTSQESSSQESSSQESSDGAPSSDESATPTKAASAATSRRSPALPPRSEAEPAPAVGDRSSVDHAPAFVGSETRDAAELRAATATSLVVQRPATEVESDAPADDPLRPTPADAVEPDPQSPPLPDAEPPVEVETPARPRETRFAPRAAPAQVVEDRGNGLPTRAVGLGLLGGAGLILSAYLMIFFWSRPQGG